MYGNIPAFISRTCCARESVSNDTERYFMHVRAYFINNIKYKPDGCFRKRKQSYLPRVSLDEIIFFV